MNGYTTIYNSQGMLSGTMGDAFSTISKTSSAAAGLIATSGGSSALIAAGVAAETVPVIGTILGSVAIIAGFIATQRAKVKSIKSSLADATAQRDALNRQNNELDQMIVDASNQRDSIINQINNIGIGVNSNAVAGLGSLSDWLSKTFTPGKYYGAQIDDVNSQIVALTNTVESKIGVMQQIQQQLTDLGDQLTGGMFTQKVGKYLLWGAGGMAAAFGLYYLYKYFKNRKKKNS
jgi:hypothetical protein